MTPIKPYLITIVTSLCLGIANSCSQSSSAADQTLFGIYEASTPCDDLSKSMLEIPPEFKCEFMKWKLTFYKDSKTSNPANFNLTCTFGMAKQASRDFLAGAKTIELNGKWSMRTGTKDNPEARIFDLRSENPVINLSFLQAGPNLLHLLDKNNQLMIGGPWSYTFNRVNPVATKSEKSYSRIESMQKLDSDSAIVGIYFGRTPCSNSLLEIKNITAEGCQIVKCLLTLYQDIKTHTPTTFHLYTIYVGKGDTKYSTTGKWSILRGSYADPSAIVYQLEPDSGKLQNSLLLLKLDNNILCFLDNDRNPMVGNNYASYTLNIDRTKK